MATTGNAISNAMSPLLIISLDTLNSEYKAYAPPCILRAIQPVHHVCAMPAAINGIPQRAATTVATPQGSLRGWSQISTGYVFRLTGARKMRGSMTTGGTYRQVQ